MDQRAFCFGHYALSAWQGSELFKLPPKQPGLGLGRKGRLVEFILTLREYRFRVQGLYIGVLVYRVASLGFRLN